MEEAMMIGKGLATIGLAIACSTWMYTTKGKSGIGWFLLGLIILW